jgi:hypothetical protein
VINDVIDCLPATGEVNHSTICFRIILSVEDVIVSGPLERAGGGCMKINNYYDGGTRLLDHEGGLLIILLW